MKASDNRSQKLTADFRRRQDLPTLDELLRMGSKPDFAQAVHREMQLIRAEQAEDCSQRLSTWQVAQVDLPCLADTPMSLTALRQLALEQGIKQVREVGSPLNPFLIFETGRAFFLVCTQTQVKPDPMEIALQTIRKHGREFQRCALVIDSRLTLKAGGKRDAIVAMMSERNARDGALWAQCYAPKRFWRSFKVVGEPEQAATSKNLFSEAK